MADEKRTEAENKLWDEAASVVGRMPVNLIVKFAQSMEALTEKNEKEELAARIEESIADLRKSWSEFPEKWDRDNLHELSGKMKHVWSMLDRVQKLEILDRKESAKKIAQEMMLIGNGFDRIIVEGFEFAADGLIVIEEQKPKPLPDDDIPF